MQAFKKESTWRLWCKQPNVATTYSAFAVWCCGGDGIVTWGKSALEADSFAVQRHLKNVQQVQATGGAFAAILANGSVVTWGDPDEGGDSSAVQDQLQSVRQIQATVLHLLQSYSKWISYCLGRSSKWRRQLVCPRQAQERAANSEHKWCICSCLGRWICRHVGSSKLWRWQLCYQRSAQKRVAHSGHMCCASCSFCGPLGRWIRRHLGSYGIWWWQF